MWLFPALFVVFMLFMLALCTRGMGRMGMGGCAGMPIPGEHGEITRDEYQRMRQDMERRS
jgi:uncharacterized membrane protein